jgi:flagellar biogenesis protein FliO
MKRWISWILITFAILMRPAFAYSAQGERVAPQRPIPFKTEPTPIEEYGPRVGLAILALIALAGGGFYYVRKRFPKLQFFALKAITGTNRRLQVVERVRLNPRCSLYLVKLDQREILLGQCGDSLAKIDGPIAELEDETHS